MRKLSFLLMGLACLMAGQKLFAGAPMTSMGRAEQYIVSYSSVIVSSTPIVSPSTAAYQGGRLGGIKLPGTLAQRTVSITFLPTSLQGGTSIFWMLGASTNAIYSGGNMLVLSTAAFPATGGAGTGNTNNFPTTLTIEAGSQINVMTGIGVPGVMATIEQKKMNP